MPEATEKHCLKELRRLERTSPSSPDHSLLRTYLNWMLQFPWDVITEDNQDLQAAQQIIEEDHYGLDEVKERIMEFLAVRQLKQSHRGPILCFVGPPGVGKTSLGRSIARTLGRKFNRTSLGGVRDEAEIRGHRRTYVGALPGRIIQSLCTAGSRNPVIMLDEIDKLGKDFRGDPSAALLEALDPEQNCEFTDHYISQPVDLSRSMFILTANALDTIPPALRDRMEIIRIAGYTLEEKEHIAAGYLIPRQLEEHGLKPEQVSLAPEALRDIIRLYTREAGVRDLEREIAKICRKRARRIVQDNQRDKQFDPITPGDLQELLGVPKFSHDRAESQTPVVGSINGLSWTQVGGEVLLIEANVIPGRGKIKLTGNLGRVMKESAAAAITWGRGYCSRNNIDFNFYASDIHIHVPEGAIPKDGPSAGVSLSCAFLSAVTGWPARQDIAMTGEINLLGKVMPIGGVKEKVLAAFNADITTILLPKDNAKNLADIPEAIREKMEFVLLEHIEDAIDRVLLKPDNSRQAP